MEDDIKCYHDYNRDGIVDEASIVRFDGSTYIEGFYVDSNGDGKIDSTDGGVVTYEQNIDYTSLESTPKSEEPASESTSAPTPKNRYLILSI